MRVGIIGFGEVGSIFARDLAAAAVGALSVYDVAFGDPASKASRRLEAAAGVSRCATAIEVAKQAELILVCVTAGSTLQAMDSLEQGLAHRPLVLDVNSVSPSTKQEAARRVEAGGGRYVEAAVMSSVPPKGLRSPMLLGGPHAAEFVEAMDGLGMDLTIFSEEIGAASSVKMCRSVMIKGLEALTTECMLAARRYGVEQQVLSTLGDTLPHADWPGLARYVISRSLVHGRRRAEEMVEVARTVDEVGVEPMMSRAITARQDRTAEIGEALSAGELNAGELPALLDAMWRAIQAGPEVEQPSWATAQG